MAWQRKIPFGYEIRGGQLRPHPQEGDAVRYIFGQYLAGASLLAIAEGMTGRGPRYHQHTPEWNKHMVKRVLENARYTGADGYPPLVSGEDFAAVQDQRGARNTYAPLPAETRPIQAKAVCGLCGAKLIRGHRTHGRVHWKCQNADCGQSVSLSDETLAAGGIVIDKTAHSVTIDGKSVDLSYKEFELLAYFLENKGIALSREKILNNVWNYDYFGDARTIDTHVKKLRSKMEGKGELIKTIWGMGYKFDVE